MTLGDWSRRVFGNPVVYHHVERRNSEKRRSVHASGAPRLNPASILLLGFSSKLTTTLLQGAQDRILVWPADKMVKIHSIEYFRVLPRWLFVKVIDEEGRYGWGESTLEGHTEAVEGTLNALCKRFVGYEAE